MRRPLAARAVVLTAAVTLSLAPVALAPAAFAHPGSDGRAARPAATRVTASTTSTGARTTALRPTDSHDPRGDSYTTTNVKKKCSTHICVHWVDTTADKAPAGWADTTLSQMNKIWAYEVDKLKFRAPMSDGTRGGNKKFDVYLKNVAPKGYAGYCAKERSIGGGYLASSYCVLDNDFLPSEFAGRPALANLRVTAAHEFFHSIQMAYDSDEDAWLVESTATWMEERYADDVNNNRKYLPVSQVAVPGEPLDVALTGDTPQFGNWVWWEYLSSRLGNGIVRTVWTKAGEYKGAGHMYSTQAVVAALKKDGGFKKRFGSYASANVFPAGSYAEGASWGVSAPMNATHVLSAGTSTGGMSVSVDHMAAGNVRIFPGGSVVGTGQRLRINVNGPGSSASPVAVVTVKKRNGTLTRSSIALDGNGVGQGIVLFDTTTVESVTVTLGNASTRFACWTQPGADPSYSCAGAPKDDDKVFAYTATSFTV